MTDEELTEFLQAGAPFPGIIPAVTSGDAQSADAGVQGAAQTVSQVLEREGVGEPVERSGQPRRRREDAGHDVARRCHKREHRLRGARFRTDASRTIRHSCGPAAGARVRSDTLG